MTDEREVLVEVKNLEVTYGSGRKAYKAVKNANFTIYKGETFGLVGESGCGKTTVGRSLVRLYRPTGGQILLDGTPGEVFAHADTLRTAGLDVPQCTAAVQYLQARGVRIRGNLNTPEQCAAALLDAWRTRGGAGRTQAGK